MIRRALFTIASLAAGVFAFVACIEDERLPPLGPPPAATSEAGAEGGASGASPNEPCGYISSGSKGNINCPADVGDPVCKIDSKEVCCPGDPTKQCQSTCFNSAGYGCFSDLQCAGTDHCCVAGSVVDNTAKKLACEDGRAIAARTGAVTVCKSSCDPLTEVQLCETSGSTCPALMKCMRTTYVIPGYPGTSFTRAVGACQDDPTAAPKEK